MFGVTSGADVLEVSKQRINSPTAYYFDIPSQSLFNRNYKRFVCERKKKVFSKLRKYA